MSFFLLNHLLPYPNTHTTPLVMGLGLGFGNPHSLIHLSLDFSLVLMTVVFGLEFLGWYASSLIAEKALLGCYMRCFKLFPYNHSSYFVGLLGGYYATPYRVSLTFNSCVRVFWFNENSYSHVQAHIEAAGFYSTYTDSGVWDTFILLTFDRFYRLVYVFSIAPLSENNVIEKTSLKVLGELLQNKIFSLLKKNLSLGQVLLNTAYAISLSFVILTYVGVV